MSFDESDIEEYDDDADDFIEEEDQDNKTGTAIMLLGVPGVGKTYLLDNVDEQIEANGFIVVSMGSVMFDVALAQDLVNDRDDMRNLSRPEQVQLQTDACEFINNEYLLKGQNIILDTHATVLGEKGYLSALSVWTAEAIQIDYIVLLEASPEVILERRSNDKSRRRKADLNEIAQHQSANFATVFAYALMQETQVKVINNDNGERAKEAFLTLFDE